MTVDRTWGHDSMRSDLRFERSTGRPFVLPPIPTRSSNDSRDWLFDAKSRKFSASMRQGELLIVKEDRLWTRAREGCQHPSKVRERKLGRKHGSGDRRGRYSLPQSLQISVVSCGKGELKNRQPSNSSTWRDAELVDPMFNTWMRSEFFGWARVSNIKCRSQGASSFGMSLFDSLLIQLHPVRARHVSPVSARTLRGRG